MVDAMRAMLDSLMGKERNAIPSERKKLSPEEQRRQRLRDPALCKYFLCGFCPNDLFLNTRVSLGHCDGTHDDVLAEEWNKLTEREKRDFGYEELFMKRIQQLVDDMDRKIARHKERMEDENARAPQIDPETRDLLAELGQKIGAKTRDMERLTEEGDIDGSSGLFREIEALKERKEAIMAQVQASLDRPGTNRLKAVCDICSAFTMTSDTEGRIQDHLQGKQHQGYLRMRETLRQLKQMLRARQLGRDERRPVDKEKERREAEKLRRASAREREREPGGRAAAKKEEGKAEPPTGREDGDGTAAAAAVPPEGEADPARPPAGEAAPEKEPAEPKPEVNEATSSPLDAKKEEKIAKEEPNGEEAKKAPEEKEKEK
eukprot:EG_transcript_16849